MEIDHIVPESLGGETRADNLWLACTLCNRSKGSQISAEDPVSGESVRLFDPRRHPWGDHFRWSDDGERIVGRSATGRATIVALQLNRTSLVIARRLWVRVGWHPPDEE